MDELMDAMYDIVLRDEVPGTDGLSGASLPKVETPVIPAPQAAPAPVPVGPPVALTTTAPAVPAVLWPRVPAPAVVVPPAGLSYLIPAPAPVAATSVVVAPPPERHATELAQLRAQGMTQDGDVLRMLLEQHGGSVLEVVSHLEHTRREEQAVKHLEAAVAVLVAEGHAYTRQEIRYFAEAFGGDLALIRNHLRSLQPAVQTAAPMVRARDYTAEIGALEAKGYQVDRAKAQSLLEAFEGNVVEVEKVLAEVVTRRGRQGAPNAEEQSACACMGASKGYHRQGCKAAPST